MHFGYCFKLPYMAINCNFYIPSLQEWSMRIMNIKSVLPFLYNSILHLDLSMKHFFFCKINCAMWEGNLLSFRCNRNSNLLLIFQPIIAQLCNLTAIGRKQISLALEFISFSVSLYLCTKYFFTI